ncbi:MAG: PqqD family protein [Bacteroidales bacterium]|nr:PqqD family protein [Bacteroidales bacterium]
MRLDSTYKIYSVEGENVILQPLVDGAMSRVVGFNESSLFLWNGFQNVDFNADDLVQALLSEYEVEESVARADVDGLLAQLRDNGLLIE